MRERLSRPIDPSSLAVFRILFGSLMALNVLRYEAEGWVHDLFIAPTVTFPYWGLEVIQPLPGWGMHAVFGVIFLAAVGVALGWRTRFSVGVFWATFTYVELIDRTTYLNHYYLVSILAALMFFMPVSAVWSLDARRKGSAPSIAVWPVWVLRSQLVLVYVFAGIAKVRPDWLLRGEPLATWLGRYADLPLVGPLFAEPWAAIAMSWAGCLFDLTIAFFLFGRRTRRYAYVVVIAFHVLTASLFSIGIFPWLMIAATTIFFAPDWPRRLLRRSTPTSSEVTASTRPPRWALGLLAVHFLVQLVVPLRQHLYEGPSTWHEQGFRFSWNVMVMEKTGQIDFIVRDGDGRETVVLPSEELTPLQLRMMETQPDLILAYAHHLAERWEREGRGPVAVHADGWVSLNGRRRQRLIDPAVDLAKAHDGLAPKPWIRPLGPDRQGWAHR
ncbi:MAG: HTTM domain-containing protein [Deltaproteobacteria bacterium]|nr:HTTM domain-containing protein [Deltaproteobacteria bacterium]